GFSDSARIVQKRRLGIFLLGGNLRAGPRGVVNYAVKCKRIEFTEQAKTADESRKMGTISCRVFSEFLYGLWSKPFFGRRFRKQLGFGVRRANCRKRAGPRERRCGSTCSPARTLAL